VFAVKRVKAACILQTLIFAQKPETGYTKERALKINKEEFEHYKVTLDRAKTRYQIIDTVEQEDVSRSSCQKTVQR
jgi:site-specific recombinase, resolvase family